MFSGNHSPDAARQSEPAQRGKPALRGTEGRAAGASPQQRGASNPRASELLTCQVDGCIHPIKTKYEARCRLCVIHLKAPVNRSGILSRWCQQCSQFHPIDRFQDDRKSCADGLERHRTMRRMARARKRAQTAAAAVAAATAAGVDPAEDAPHVTLEDWLAVLPLPDAEAIEAAARNAAIGASAAPSSGPSTGASGPSDGIRADYEDVEDFFVDLLLNGTAAGGSGAGGAHQTSSSPDVPSRMFPY